MLSLRNRRAVQRFREDLIELGISSDAAVSDIASSLDKAEVLKPALCDGGDRFVRVCPIHGIEVEENDAGQVRCKNLAQMVLPGIVREDVSEGHEVRAWLIYDLDRQDFVGVAQIDVGGFLLGDDIDPREVVLRTCKTCSEVYRAVAAHWRGNKGVREIKTEFENYCSKRCREASDKEEEGLLWH